RRHLRQGARGVRAPPRQPQRELHLREGGLLLRLPDELPPIPQPVPRHVPARWREHGGDAAPRRHAAATRLRGPVRPPAEPPLYALLPAETASPEETLALGERLAAHLRPGDVLALY